jgi:predicted TIM-barrel fold metal-dependent hydrolase
MYNRWLADFCSVAPERLIGLVQIPMWDVDTAVDEVQWAADHGFRGINFPASRLGWSQYDDPSWEPLWSVAEETGMVLTTHAGGNIDPAVMQRIGTPLFVLEAAGPMNRRSIPRMIIGGVFERHPGLKLAMTEQPGTWIPQLLTEMDSATLAHPARDGKPLPKLPSEYFATNVFVGASFMAPFEAEAALADGTWRNMFWGRDYPHPEGTWTFDEAGDSVPLTYLSLRHAFAGDLPEHEVRAMVGTNAVEIYGLDGDALRAVADKIGPTYEEITTPLDDIPDLDGPVRQGMGRFAFRTMGAWA